MAACSPSDPQNIFVQKSDFARMVMGLFTFIIWLAAIVFVLVEGALVYALIRFRRKPNDGLPVQTHGNSKLEIGLTIAPAVVLAVIAVPTVGTVFKTYEVPTGPDVVNVEVIGHQFWWEYRYPDFGGFSTANDMHVPAGKTVVLHITSADVIHSHWIPQLGVKRDAIPTHVNTIWFKADEPGTYFGQCAEFCGEEHANMKLRTFTQTQQDFDAWVQTMRSPAVSPATDLARRGMQIVTTGVCAGCHTIDGTAAQGKIGPNLTHFATRSSMAGAIEDLNEANLRAWLTNTQAVKPGNLMVIPPQTPADMDALVAYLLSLH
jgi:cytochrome c oxidase subunit 2